MDKIDQAFREVFSHPRAEEVLEYLKARTVSQTTLPAACNDGQAMAILMGVREGENNIYRLILSKIEKGRKEG